MIAVYDKNTLNNGWASVIIYGDNEAMTPLPIKGDWLEINPPVEITELIIGKIVTLECNIETGETRYKITDMPIEIPETSPIDFIGMAVVQNTLDMEEIKGKIDMVGQGVVEIMLNQQMGGM